MLILPQRNAFYVTPDVLLAMAQLSPSVKLAKQDFSLKMKILVYL
jgi:hypothetical protein